MVIVRVDDVGWGTEKVIDHEMKEYSKFHKLFAERNIPYVAACIPAIFDEGMMQWARENFYPGVSVFLHGWNHIPTEGGKVVTEFRGRSKEVQEEKVRFGMEKFREFNPVGFVPPYNSYDLKTVNVCAAAGLRYFLVGAEYRRGSLKNPPHEFKIEHGIPIIPERWDLYCNGDYNKMLYVAEMVKGLSENPVHPDVISLHCVWEYPNLNTDCLPRLLDALKDKVIDIRNWEFKK